MSKKTIILIIILLIVLGIAGWLIVLQKTGPQGDGGDEDSKSFFTNLFPFGKGEDVTEDRGPSPDGGIKETEIPLIGSSGNAPLRQLTSISTVGYIATTTLQGLAIRYMDRAVGNIHEINMETFEQARITNTTLPGMSEIIWHHDAENYILRYADNKNVLQTYVGRIVHSESSTSSEFATLLGDFMATNIPHVIPNADHSRILYTRNNGSGGSVGVTTAFDYDNNNDKLLFNSPFLAWILEWPNSNLVTATSKASSIADGFSYFVDTSDGSFTKILGGIKGLTINTNHAGSVVLYSSFINNKFSTSVYDTTTKRTVPASIGTLSEKCAWSTVDERIVYCGVPDDVPSGKYPDEWYQGKISFSDSIWEINIETNAIRLISAPTIVAKTRIDVIEPSVTPDGAYLLFKNKKDSTLWSLKLQENIVEEEVAEEEIDS